VTHVRRRTADEDYLSFSGGRISTSVPSLPGPMASVISGATSAGAAAGDDVRVLRAGCGRRRLDRVDFRAAALRAPALRAGALRAGALRAAFFAVFRAAFFAAPRRAPFLAVPFRAPAFFAAPLRAVLPLDLRAFATS
jgi:hypothetical protein